MAVFEGVFVGGFLFDSSNFFLDKPDFYWGAGEVEFFSQRFF